MIYYYTGIYYPEHEEEYKKATRDIEIINMYDTINGYCMSPLHSSDGELGKPHYHIILQSTKPLAKKTIKEMSNWLVCVLPVNNLISMYNYLTHNGFPDKEQFPADVKPQEFGHFNINLGDSNSIIKEILSYCSVCFDLADLTNTLMLAENYDALKYLSSHAYFFNTLMKQNAENIKKSIDFE